MSKKCLKCGYERKAEDNAPEYECPKCGVIYAKAKKNAPKINKVAKQVCEEKPLILPDEPTHIEKFREFHLKSDEKIIAWSEGYIGEMMGAGKKKQHNGVLLVTGERVAFYRKGLLGEVLETIPLEKISSIERKSFMGHRTITMHTSNDELSFKTFNKGGEINLVGAIEAGRNQKEPARNGNQVDPLELLKKLGELKELGLITEKEFIEKKAVFLERL